MIKNKKSKIVYIQPDEANILEAVSKWKGISESEIIRHALNMYLELFKGNIIKIREFNPKQEKP